MATEIEELREKKEVAKRALETEEQKEKSLQEAIDILEEKIAIRDLETKLGAKQESVRQLELRKSQLEDEWSQPNQDAKEDEASKEPSPELVVNSETPCDLEPISSDEPNSQKKRGRFF